MIMLQMSGGLGNQMFFYALYKELQKEGKDVCIEDFTHYEDIGRKDKCLEEIFALTYEKAHRKVYERITDSSMQPWKRLRRKLLLPLNLKFLYRPTAMRKATGRASDILKKYKTS